MRKKSRSKERGERRERERERIGEMKREGEQKWRKKETERKEDKKWLSPPLSFLHLYSSWYSFFMNTKMIIPKKWTNTPDARSVKIPTSGNQTQGKRERERSREREREEETACLRILEKGKEGELSKRMEMIIMSCKKDVFWKEKFLPLDSSSVQEGKEKVRIEIRE